MFIQDGKPPRRIPMMSQAKDLPSTGKGSFTQDLHNQAFMVMECHSFNFPREMTSKKEA